MSEELKNNIEPEVDSDCPISRSNLCYWLVEKGGCDKCYIRTLKTADQKQDAKGRWEETLSLLPQDIDETHQAEDCQFCKDEVHEADGYAVVEMAHPEPYFEKGMFFGLGKKVRTPVGSLLSLQFSVCPRCRKVMRMPDVIQVASILLGVVIGIILLMIPGISEKMADLFILLPAIFFVLIIVAGYYVGKNASMAYLKRNADRVKLDLSEVPMIAKLLSRGWFFFQMSGNGMPRISFSKKKAYSRLRRAGQDGAEQEKAQYSQDDDFPLDNMNI
ncbi:tripartite tricarboxylate transporter permease [Christensenellaceae bacterium OttesenSCG-928-K19]|nr:tripartite tricarboxylate transporter permease [Christensenellaceae bacterium OttesenSCG-928-K19]